MATQKALEAILSMSSDAIVATDRAGVITFWNPGATRIFGFASGEAVGQSLDIIIPENLRKRHWDGFHHTMATGTSRYGDGDLLSVPGLTKDGRRISVEFTIAILRDAQQAPAGTVAIMRDVTKRFEEVLELRRKLAARSRHRPAKASRYEASRSQESRDRKFLILRKNSWQKFAFCSLHSQ